MTNSESNPIQPLLDYAQSHLPELLADVRRLVQLESPSRDKAAVDRCGEFIAGRSIALGGNVTCHTNTDLGNQLQIDFPTNSFGKSDNEQKPILLLGHFDTVWDLGTLASMPITEENGLLHGPGVFDMKAGIAIAWQAIAALRELHGTLPHPVTFLLNPDEEIGSPVSRAVTEQLAKRSVAVLVLEPAQGPDGKVKTSRKGVGGFTIKVKGVSAHAGLDFQKGQNAVLELAEQIVRASHFTDLSRGLTVSVGEVKGGSPATNVVPACAEASFDVRIARVEDGPAIEAQFRSLQPVNPNCPLEIIGEINRPPLERTSQVATLYELAKATYSDMGLHLDEAAVGGGSDGNFTGALGIPTLDGLGPVGEGAHSPNESIIISELPRRVALIAGLISRIAQHR